MLVLKSILFFSTLIICNTALTLYEDRARRTRLSDAVFILAILLAFSFCLLLILTNWNVFSIPKILLFISVCSGVLFPEHTKAYQIFYRIGLAVSILTYLVAGYLSTL